MGKYNPIRVSSKFPICALPLRLDSYSYCDYNCKYCFSNNRLIGERTLSEPNFNWLKNKFKKIFDDNDVNYNNFLEVLLSKDLTLHAGAQADCFQPNEDKYEYTGRIVEICNEYEEHILFSTKSDRLYGVDVTPEFHSFQLSFSNVCDDKYLEPNVPLFEKRYGFYKDLLDKGFDVGIRIQPFIPEITDVGRIVELFDDASHFVIEGIKLVPGSSNNKDLMEYINLNKGDFTQMGLLNIKPSLRMELYRDIIELFESKGISYSIADNDLHYLGNNKCCCGDELVKNTFELNNTTIFQNVKDYDLEYILDRLGDFENCKCSRLYNSSRRYGCETVKEFYEYKFASKRSIFSPKFQYRESGKQLKLI